MINFRNRPFFLRNKLQLSNRFISLIIGYELTLTRCELCSVVADYLSMKLEDPKFEKVGVETAVTKFCPLLRNLKEPVSTVIIRL
jgi:hypothetical protein